MKEGTSIEKHLKRMKELTDRLAAIGAPIAEEDQVVTLLGSFHLRMHFKVSQPKKFVMYKVLTGDMSIGMTFYWQKLIHHKIETK